MSDQPPRVADAPEAIWLNYGALERDCIHHALAHSGDVTWREDAVFVSDVRYVRADLLDRIQAQRDELREKAQAVVDRWDSPNWKNLPHTGEFIAALRAAVESATKDQT